MSVLGICGSPRENGSTARLVHEALAGAAGEGAATEYLHLETLNIRPCTGCMGCRETARCVVDDGMTVYYAAIERNRPPLGLVIGTPIYFDHISAQLKAWIDRHFSYSYTAKGERMFPPGYRAVLIATYDWDNPTIYDSVVDWLAERLEFYHAIQVIAKITLPNATGCPPDRQPDKLRQAREAGKMLARG